MKIGAKSHLTRATMKNQADPLSHDRDAAIGGGKILSHSKLSATINQNDKSIHEASSSVQLQDLTEETTSSSSSSSSSSDSVRSSEAATIVDSVRVVLKQQNKQNKATMRQAELAEDEGEEVGGGNGSQLDITQRPIELIGETTTPQVVTAPGQVKQYKNSPFGLNRHYLTMPESNPIEPQQAVKLYNRQGPFVDTRPATNDFDSGGEDDDDDDDSDDDAIAANRNPERGRQQNAWTAGRDAAAPVARRSKQTQGGEHKRLSPNHQVLDSHSTHESYQDLTKDDALADQDSILLDAISHHHHHQQHPGAWPDKGNNLPQHSPGINHEFDPSAGAKCCPSDAKCSVADCCCDPYFRCSRPDLNPPSSSSSPSKSHLHHRHSINKKNSKLAAPPQEANSLLVKFSSIIYATFLVILGCILHVSELRQKSKNSSDHIYTTIVALIGVIWLLFLQADLHRYKRYASKYILIETIFNDHRQKSLEAQRQRDLMAAGHHVDMPATRSTSSSSASLVNGDRLSMNTEVIFKKTAYKMYQQRAAALDRHHHQHHLHGNQQYPYRNRSDSRLSQLSSSRGSEPLDGASEFAHHKIHGSKQSTGSGAEQPQHQQPREEHENLVPAYKFLHGKMGANFYLKCGMAAFCFGHVIHEGLRFGQQLYFFGTGNVHCRDSAALVAHLITPLYSFYQLFMMFKYSNLVINRHKVLARFGLMHIIGTSVTFWFRTILEEAFEDFVHKMDYFKTNKPHMSLTLVPPAAAQAKSPPSEPTNHLISLLTTIADSIKSEANERSELFLASQQPQQHNNSIGMNSTTTTMAQSLLTLMSSPISATITPQIVRNLPDSYACAQNTLLTTKSMNALPYLYPFTIEYNLLLAATFLSLYFNIGKIGVPGAACKPSLMHYSNMLPKPSRRSLAGGVSQYGSNVESSDNNSFATRAMGQDGFDKEVGEFKSNFVVNADCHSANKGLFCGFFVLLVTIITIVIFFVTINKPTHIQLGIKINLIQEATLTALILLVTLAGFKQVVKLNRNPYLKDKVTTDDVLMLIPLPFFFIHSLLSFRAETASMSAGSISAFSSFILHGGSSSLPPAVDAAATASLKPGILLTGNTNHSSQTDSRPALKNLLAGQRNGTSGRFVDDFINGSSANGRIVGGKSRIPSNGSAADGDNHSSTQVDHFKLLTVALNIVVMIEVLVQTNFIIDGMRRCSESRYLRFKKPGRELITFAILLNITYWIVATFETKSVEQYKTEIEYYGPLPYMFISHTTLPVMLFYRYHSSVCLAEIWNRAYKPPKKR